MLLCALLWERDGSKTKEETLFLVSSSGPFAVAVFYQEAFVAFFLNRYALCLPLLISPLSRVSGSLPMLDLQASSLLHFAARGFFHRLFRHPETAVGLTPRPDRNSYPG